MSQQTCLACRGQRLRPESLDVIKTADWIVDLGPEGGDEGGWIVAQGTPEEVTQVVESYTGQFLKGMLS